MAQIPLAGNLGRDVEVKTTPNGTEYATFSIPDNEWVNGATQTTWFNCTVWNPSAFVKGLKKGSNIACVGAFAPRRYTNRDGVEAISFDVKVYGDSVRYAPGNRQRTDDATADTSADDEDAPF